MHVAVLGGGYAGLTLARRLERRLPDRVELTLVDESGTHLVQHELHRVIRRPNLSNALEVRLGDVLGRTDVLEARVTDVDPDARRVRLTGDDAPSELTDDAPSELTYDYAAVCLGAETEFYDVDGLREHATPLKRLPHAETIRENALDVCEGGGRIVVGGAGLSGVQVAGELAALAREEGAAERVEVLLLEQFPTVAPGFPRDFQLAIHDQLLARGVDVRTDTTVRRATGTRVDTDADALDYDALVWTGGIRGPRALGGRRPPVRADLRLTESTFVLGDAARIVDADGEPVPASASAAVRQARTVAGNLARLVDGADDAFEPRLDRYRFDVPGWIVSIGDGAVAQVGPTVVSGGAAKALKASVGAGYLAGNRAIREAVELVEEELQTPDRRT